MDNAFGRAYVDYMFQYIFDKVDNDIKVNYRRKEFGNHQRNYKKGNIHKVF